MPKTTQSSMQLISASLMNQHSAIHAKSMKKNLNKFLRLMLEQNQTLLSLMTSLICLPSLVLATQAETSTTIAMTRRTEEAYFFFNTQNTSRYQISGTGDCFNHRTFTIFNMVLNTCNGYAINNTINGNFIDLYGDEGCPSPGGTRGFIEFSRYFADNLDQIFEQCTKDTMHDGMYEHVSAETNWLIGGAFLGLMLLCGIGELLYCRFNRSNANAAQGLNTPIINQVAGYQSVDEDEKDIESTPQAFQIQEADHSSKPTY